MLKDWKCNLMQIFIILFAVFLFNLVIFIHEFGHFFTAKLFGVKVNEFAIGMGPKIFKIQKGETLYSIRLFPIGGFCAMEGEDEESESEDSFGKKAAWKRIIIVAAGAIMNIILGIIMMFILLCQEPKIASTRINKFSENSVSNQYGLKENDEIIAVNGYRTYSYNDLMFSLSSDGKDSFDIDVNRNGNAVKLNDVKFNMVEGNKGKKHIQIDFYVNPLERNLINILKYTFIDTVSTVRIVWSSLVGLVTGRFKLTNMSGPVGIASAIGSATSEGLKVGILSAISNVLSIMAMITINLGIFNLLPLPALDGGRLVFLIAEMIFGKSLSAKHEGWIHAVGLFLFLALMVFITYSDIIKLIKGE